MKQDRNCLKLEFLSREGRTGQSKQESKRMRPEESPKGNRVSIEDKLYLFYTSMIAGLLNPIPNIATKASQPCRLHAFVFWKDTQATGISRFLQEE